MTSAAMRGDQPSQGSVELGTVPATEPDSVSAANVAKDRATHVGRSAQVSGKQVAGAAADEAKNVTAEARRQARDLTQEVGNGHSSRRPSERTKPPPAFAP